MLPLPSFNIITRPCMMAFTWYRQQTLGGSGHEPAHAGFVGTAMLDVAVCGAVFASPNAAQVESALRTIQSPKGTLIIVKNYTGDKLNFTIAAERFRLVTGLPIRQLKCPLMPRGLSKTRTRVGD